METGDVRYRDKVNCGMWIGSGMRKGSEVIYEYVMPALFFEWTVKLIRSVHIDFHSAMSPMM